VDSILRSPLRAQATRAGHGAARRAVLDTAFLLVCLRFQIASARSAGPELGPALLLGTAAFVLGAWNPPAALFAFTLAVPLLIGVEVDSLVECASPLGTVFSAMWMGMTVFALLRRAGRAPAARAGSAGQSVGPIPDTPDLSPAFLVSDLLVVAVLLSLGWQLWRHRDAAGLWPALFDRPVFGFGEPMYFLTSAFLWLQGLFFFKSILGVWSGRCGAEGDGGRRDGPWVVPFLAATAATMAAFVFVQLVLHVPEGWTGAGFQAPYEDISSFGSIGVAVFIFAASTLRAMPPPRLAASVAACGVLLSLVVLSWSRAAWLAGLVFLLLVAFCRLSWKWAASSLIGLVATVALINAVARNAPQPEQPYLARLAALARIESPLNKDPVRLNLYRKAAAMIERRPLTGHGIGSFYRESVAFAPPDDPHGSEPEFAHNAILQVAAELGLPAAAALAALTAWGLWRGIGTWLAGRPQRPAVLALGTALSLGAYLQTQMTANSLNVYASNQFFFWFLLAALLATGAGAPRTSG